MDTSLSTPLPRARIGETSESRTAKRLKDIGNDRWRQLPRRSSARGRRPDALLRGPVLGRLAWRLGHWIRQRGVDALVGQSPQRDASLPCLLARGLDPWRCNGGVLGL